MCRTAPASGSASIRKPSTAAHFARAAMEGVTLGMNYGLRRLRQLGRQAPANPRHRRRRQIEILAPDHGRCVRRRSGHGQGERRRGLRRGLAGALVLALAAGRARQDQRHHRPIRPSQQKRARPSAKAGVQIYRELQMIQDEFSRGLAPYFPPPPPLRHRPSSQKVRNFHICTLKQNRSGRRFRSNPWCRGAHAPCGPRRQRSEI